MIRVNELRIGNWMFDENTEENYQIGGYHLSWWDSSGEIIGSNPIPLTEEWLIKFGFECINPEEEDEGDRDWILKGALLSIAREGGWFVMKQNSNTVGLDSSFKYVHQLQNLFHSLTGEELKRE